MAINWQTCINNYVEAQRKPYEKPADNTFRASELTGCVRQCAARRLNLKHFDVNVLRNFEIGTQLHRFLQEKVGVGFVDECVAFEKTVKLEHDGLVFTGHVDCFDGSMVYDFKTVKGFTYVTPGNVSKGYIYQLHIYMRALNVQEATLVYVDKNTWEVKNISVYYDEVIFEEILKFCKQVQEAVDAYNCCGKLPDKDNCYACKIEEIEAKATCT